MVSGGKDVNILLRIVERFLMIDPLEVSQPFTVTKRYRRFRSTLFFVMTAISILPLAMTAGLSYVKYRSLLENETKNYLRWNAEGAQRTIQAFVDELRTVITFVGNGHSYRELSDQGRLSELYARLKSEYPGLVDLGLIDPDGVQRTYAGPFNLKGKNYAHGSWFREAVAQPEYISPVFLGYRNVPHFVITHRKEAQVSGRYGVLRASIDAATLQRFIETITTETSEDIFIVARDGALQTASRYYGDVREHYALPFVFNNAQVSAEEYFKRTEGTIAISEQISQDVRVLQAVAPLSGTPWAVVLVKKGYVYGKSWSTFRNQLLLILFVGVVLGVLVTLRTTQVLARRIRETDQKREVLLSETENASKLASVGRLAAGVAHEINNPLAIINQKAGLMKDLMQMTGEFEIRDKLDGLITGILAGVDRCKIITHRLLGFARRMDVSLEHVEVNELLREVLSFLDKETLYRRIRIDLSLEEGLPRILGDRGQMQQIFLNILNNAIDAIGEGGGRVSVISRRKDPITVQLLINDNGPGIPPDILEHILEPFFTTKESDKGTALGLSITKNLVTKLGGEIFLESTVGKGTTFTLEFPASKTAEEG